MPPKIWEQPLMGPTAESLDITEEIQPDLAVATEEWPLKGMDVAATTEKSDEEKLEGLREAGWLQKVAERSQDPLGVGPLGAILSAPAYVGMRGMRYMFQPKARGDILEAKMRGSEANVSVPVPRFDGEKEVLVHIGGSDPQAAQLMSEGFGKQKAYVDPKNGASFLNPETREYLWVPEDSAQEAADGGLLPESKEKYLERQGIKMHEGDDFGAFSAGVQSGMSFGLSAPMYKAAVGKEKYEKAAQAAEEFHPVESTVGEVVGTLPWLFAGAGPIGLGVKAAAGAPTALTMGRAGSIGSKILGQTALKRAAARSLGQAALGAEIGAGQELARQTASGNYDFSKIGKAAGTSGLIFGALGAAGEGVGAAVKKVASGSDDLSNILNAGKKLGESKYADKLARAEQSGAQQSLEQSLYDVEMAGLHKRTMENIVDQEFKTLSEASAKWRYSPEMEIHFKAAQKRTDSAAARLATAEENLAEQTALKVAAEQRSTKANEIYAAARDAATAAKEAKVSAIKQVGVGFAKKYAAQAIIGGAAGYHASGGDYKIAALTTVGSAFLLKPLGRRALLKIGQASANPALVSAGKNGIRVATTAAAIPVVKLTNEQLLKVREELSEESLDEWKEGLTAGYKQAGINETNANREVSRQLAVLNLLKKELPKSSNDTNGMVRYSNILDAVKHPENILNRMVKFELNPEDIEVMRTLNPNQFKSWKSAAIMVLKQKAYKLSQKQRRTYQLLAGGQYRLKRTNETRNIQANAFGSGEEKEPSMSKADMPAQQTNQQRIEGGLGSKPK